MQAASCELKLEAAATKNVQASTHPITTARKLTSCNEKGVFIQSTNIGAIEAHTEYV
jgi:hypothetical protein